MLEQEGCNLIVAAFEVSNEKGVGFWKISIRNVRRWSWPIERFRLFRSRKF